MKLFSAVHLHYIALTANVTATLNTTLRQVTHMNK